MQHVLSGTVFGGQGQSTIYNMPKRSADAIIKLTPKRKRYGPKRSNIRRRRISAARPMRSLKLNYRATNVYRYMRETIPSTYTFTLIPAGPGFPAMGYMSFENLKFNLLPGYADFVNLYARYKVDKIITTLTPMYETVTQVNHSSQLEITRVNTKWMTGDFPIAANSDLQLNELAQLQAKSKSLYAHKKPLTIVTMNPGTKERSVVDSSGNEVDARGKSPRLSLSGANAALDVQFKHNAVVFGARVDGTDLDATFKYRVTHKVFFRCSQVG